MDSWDLADVWICAFVVLLGALALAGCEALHELKRRCAIVKRRAQRDHLRG